MYTDLQLVPMANFSPFKDHLAHIMLSLLLRLASYLIYLSLFFYQTDTDRSCDPDNSLLVEDQSRELISCVCYLRVFLRIHLFISHASFLGTS